MLVSSEKAPGIRCGELGVSNLRLVCALACPVLCGQTVARNISDVRTLPHRQDTS